MTSNSEFLIFRDGRMSVLTANLQAAIRAELCHSVSGTPTEHVITLLLRGCELETGLRDVPAPAMVCRQAARLSDLFADALVRCDSSQPVPDWRRLASSALSILDQIHYSGTLNVGVAEGFAYYAIHPLDYADLIVRRSAGTSSALVIGVRSIGTTLSAVVAAKLRHIGIAAQRITARPTGHPYDRTCRFESVERDAIEQALAGGADFFVCDEGPGRSGSSLLSAAEALERQGVPRSKIVILCSYDPDPRSLCGPDAARRWARYRVAAAGMTRRLPANVGEYLGGDQWQKFFSTDEHQSALWPEMERLRYRSADGHSVLTFEGHGAYGAAVRSRNQALAEAEFSPAYFGQEEGFGRNLVPTEIVTRATCSQEMLTHMARYCAWRAREFAVANADTPALQTMVRVNFEREFGVEPGDIELPLVAPAVCDARMMPHEWLHTAEGRWLKLDGAIHGDDHFFPGPCDIAWDLAGISVEWRLSISAREYLLAEYTRASGDDASFRIDAYQLAYPTFRTAWSKMAAASTADHEQGKHLMRDYWRYREVLQNATSHVVGFSESRRPRASTVG